MGDEEQKLQQDTASMEEEDSIPRPTVLNNDDTAKVPHGQTRTSLFSDDSIVDTSVEHRQSGGPNLNAKSLNSKSLFGDDDKDDDSIGIFGSTSYKVNSPEKLVAAKSLFDDD